MIDEVERLEPYLSAWDELAVSREIPFSAPGWMLAWWREARIGDARLRVILVFEGERLIGIGPFFAQVWLGIAEYRLLAAGFCHRIAPLAANGRERDVADAIAGALASAKPAPDSVVYEGVDARTRWPELIAEAWPGPRPRLRNDSAMPAHRIDLDGSFDGWLGRRSKGFRKSVRRRAKKLDEAGVRRRSAADETAVDTLVQLHHRRWEALGGGSGLDRRAGDAIADACARLGDSGRAEVLILESPHGPIAAELLIYAGETMSFWGGGFDPRWSTHAPGTQAIVAALEGAAERGVSRADLGGGGDDYKRRLGDRDDPIAWRTMFPRGRRYPLVRLRLAPKHVRTWLRERVRALPERERRLLLRLARRG